MAEIEMMMDAGLPMSNSPTSTVQTSGGSAGIEMMGDTAPLSHSPVSTVQTSGGSAGIEMMGDQAPFNPGQKLNPYNSKTP